MANIFWQKADDVFPQAANIHDEHQREVRLRELCGDDEHLRREIAALLKADDSAERYGSIMRSKNAVTGQPGRSSNHVPTASAKIRAEN